MRNTLILAGTIATLATSAFADAVQVDWWHAMGGTNGERVNKIADNFNASQSAYKVVPTYKGNYTETMTAAVAAFRAKEQPASVEAAGASGVSVGGLVDVFTSGLSTYSWSAGERALPSVRDPRCGECLHGHLRVGVLPPARRLRGAFLLLPLLRV